MSRPDPTIPRRRSRGRLWLLRLLAIACGLLPFALLELSLRIAGVGQDLQLVIPVRGARGWYQLNPKFDEPYFGRGDLSGPEPRPFRLPKPPGTRRVLVVGGSTVVGFPYASDAAFPRMLELLLQQQAADGETIEVLNAGITAINTSTEAAVVLEGIACEPDVIVIYTGHNEFYGPGGVASGVVQLNPAWFRTLCMIGRMRIVQCVRRLARAWQPPPGDLVGTLSKDLNVALDGPVFQAAVRRFEQNLQTMIAAAKARNIPVIFAGPVANERHQPPIEPALPASGNPEEPAWFSAVRTAERHLQYEAPQKALAALQALSTGDSQHAIVQFRLAQAFDKAGDAAAAETHYRNALELDGGRFRAPAAFRSVMERLAERHSTDGVRYLDLRAALCSEDPAGVPGRLHLLEHVHFTWEGNAAVARALAAFVQQTVWSRPWSDEHSLDDEQLREHLPVAPEEHLAALTLTMLLYDKPPFRDAADAKLLAKELAWQSVSQVRELPAARRAAFEELPSEAMSGDVLLSTLEACRSAGLNDDVGELLRAAIRRRPWRCDLRIELHDWLEREGLHDAAEAELQQRAAWPCSK